MIRIDLLRIAAAALVLTAFSFAVGVIGDLAQPASANSGARVVLRIPPEIRPPADVGEAAPAENAVEDAA
ncbi:MAG: hypothetical protein K2P58_04805 [Hyphomonadaceae bacterium]|nr:hypothetical protein [Hyphomonadaceae bacterium]